MTPRGGAGRGQGRKPLPPEQQKHPHTVWLTDAQVETLKRAGGTISEGVRRLIEDRASEYRLLGTKKESEMQAKKGLRKCPECGIIAPIIAEQYACDECMYTGKLMLDIARAYARGWGVQARNDPQRPKDK